MSAATQSQPLCAKSARRIRERQFSDLQLIWEGTTRNALPHDLIFHEALALYDFSEVEYAVLAAMKKFCQLDGDMHISQCVGYFRGVLQKRAEKRAFINGQLAN